MASPEANAIVVASTEADTPAKDAIAPKTETDSQANRPFGNAGNELLDIQREHGRFKLEKAFKPTFCEAIQDGLSLIYAVVDKLNDETFEPSIQAPLLSFGSFNTTMASLKAIIEKISKTKNDERFQCYTNYVNGKEENLVETLVIKMMGDVCQTVKDYGAEKSLEKEVADVKAGIQTLKSMDPSALIKKQNGAGGHTFKNTGGTQYNATDHARQFNGTTFQGGTNFY